jgi:peroxiredoxin
MSNWWNMTARTLCTISTIADAARVTRPRRATALLAARLLVSCLLGIPAARASALTLIGQGAPDFALPAVAGDNVRLSESLGQPVILMFWGSHCAECAAQLARLNRLYDTYRSSGLVVLAVSVDDDLQRAAKYARAHPMHFPVLLDSAKSVSRAYAIDRLPTTVLIDRSGVVRYLHDADRANDSSYIIQIRALLDDEGAAAAASAALTQAGNPR